MESKELRKYRRRQAGVSAEGLLVGETNAKKENADVSLWKLYFLVLLYTGKVMLTQNQLWFVLISYVCDLCPIIKPLIHQKSIQKSLPSCHLY